MSYLDIAREITGNRISPQEIVAGSQYAINAIDVLTPKVELCHTCTCDFYIVRLQGDCPVCEGHVCARCDGCLKSSHAWRHQKIEPVQTGDSLEVILDSLRKGQAWLIVQHNALFDDSEDVDLDRYTGASIAGTAWRQPCDRFTITKAASLAKASGVLPTHSLRARRVAVEGKKEIELNEDESEDLDRLRWALG